MQRGTLKRLAALLSTLVLLGAADASASSPEDGASERAPTPTATKRADDQVTQVALRSRRVQTWLREARAEKKTARARCLDRLLSQAHAVERQARREGNRVALAEKSGHDEAIPLHETRLSLFTERSRQIGEEAYWCGREHSRRPKMKTGYRVRVLKPRLPRTSAVDPSSQAAAWR